MNFWQRFHDRGNQRGLALISPTLLWMIGLLIIPLILVLITSFGRRDPDGNVIYAFDLSNYIRLTGLSAGQPCGATPAPCFDSLYLTIIWRSLVLAFQPPLLVIRVAYPLAY